MEIKYEDVDWTPLPYVPVAGCCEHGSEPSNSYHVIRAYSMPTPLWPQLHRFFL